MKFIFIFSFLIVSCSALQTIHGPSGEGLYTLETRKEGFNPEVVRHTSLGVGQIFDMLTKRYKKEEIAERRAQRCQSDESKLWHNEFCSQLNDKKCDEGCEITAFYPLCSGGRIGDVFVTAKHCIPDENAELIAKFQLANGKIENFKMHYHSLTRNKAPYDISIVYPANRAAFKKVPELKTSNQELTIGQPVFGIGFPYLNAFIRPNKKADYDYVNAGKRVVYGQVIEPNIKKWSYCGFSNDNEKAKPETWILEPSCQKIDYSKFKYDAREENNILLTNTDMIYGLSGSFLFNANGEVIGVGSTIKASKPGPYSTTAYAVYSKIENLATIISSANGKSD